jgi:hypothetical protein
VSQPSAVAALPKAFRTAAAYSEQSTGVVLYNNGGRLVLAERGEIIATRIVSSSAMANRVHGYYLEKLATFPHLHAVDALNAAVDHAEAAWRVANRRMGRRQPWRR